MIGRERNRKAPSADLLVCFPARSHLALMPKPTCSPSRPNEPNKRFLNHHPKKSSGSSSSHRNTSMLLSKNKHMESDMSEPTSPKVTCAGQIKVRPRNGGSCKNWQSVMEEIEKLHNNNKKSKKVIKKPSWAEALGFKKDVMQFLTCLRTVRFDFRCFGSFPSANISSSDDEEDDDTDDEDEDDDDDKYAKNQEEENEDENSKAVFSKWFMVLQDNQNTKEGFIPTSGDDHHDQSASVPPSNALLLMRCRSAPAKSWLEENKEEEEEEEKEKEKEREAEMVNDEEGRRKMILEENNLVVMNYDTDFYKLSSDIAKETWVVSGINNKDQMSRSRSCKR